MKFYEIETWKGLEMNNGTFMLLLLACCLTLATTGSQAFGDVTEQLFVGVGVPRTPNVIDVDDPAVSPDPDPTTLGSGYSLSFNDRLLVDGPSEVIFDGGVLDGSVDLRDSARLTVQSGTVEFVEPTGDSVLEVAGGQVRGVQGASNSSLIVTGGLVNADVFGDAVFNANGGTFLSTGDITISGGTVIMDNVVLTGGGQLSVTGGNFSLTELLHLEAGGTATIAAGDLSSALVNVLGDSSELNLVGSDFELEIEVEDPDTFVSFPEVTPLSPGTTLTEAELPGTSLATLRGTLQDGSAFELISPTLSNGGVINLVAAVPEPGVTSLLVLATLALASRRKRRGMWTVGHLKAKAANRSKIRTACFFPCLVGLLGVAGTSSSHAQVVRTVALTGDAAPGTGNGINFLSLSQGFDGPVLNDAGQTAFLGRLTGDGVGFGNDSGIWSERSGAGLSLVARQGDSAPGIGVGVNFGSFDSFLAIDNTGQTSFSGQLIGAGVNFQNNQVIWREASGSGPFPVAREGSSAPGTTANFNSGITGRRAFNGVGQVAFRGGIDENGGSLGIWTEGNGAGLSLAALRGRTAPDVGGGATFFTFSSTPALNDNGLTAFVGTLSNGIGGVSLANNTGIWRGGNGSGLSLVVREEDVSPVAGLSFGSIESASLNNDGQIAFRSLVIGPGVNSENNSAIWREASDSTLSLVAREGDLAPGTSSGETFSFLLDPSINGIGQTVFLGGLRGSSVVAGNSRGIWSEGSGSLSLVAREGSAAPGTDSGVNFSSLTSPVLNANGQVAFLAGVDGTGVSFGNDQGIWAQNLSGSLTLIAREGDLFDVNDDPLIDDFRTILSLAFVGGSGNEDGYASGFNDRGQVAFRANFNDGTSGVFVSNLVAAIPEPGGVTLLGLVSLALAIQRRRKVCE